MYIETPVWSIYQQYLLFSTDWCNISHTHVCQLSKYRQQIKNHAIVVKFWKYISFFFNTIITFQCKSTFYDNTNLYTSTNKSTICSKYVLRNDLVLSLTLTFHLIQSPVSQRLVMPCQILKRVYASFFTTLDCLLLNLYGFGLALI